jgi:rsbT co-antagonist protein RsbR
MASELANSLDTFKRLADGAFDGITIADTTGKIVYANQSFQQLSGFGEQTIGSQITDYYPPEDSAYFQQTIYPQILKSGGWQGELEHIRPDKSRWLAQVSVIVLYDNKGTPIGTGAFFRDVTEERAREMAILEVNHRIEQSFITSPLATLEADNQGNIIRWNPAAERIFGWSAEEAMGKNAIALLVPNLALEHVTGIVDALLSGQATNSRNENITKDGRIIICQWHNAVMRNSRGEVVGWLSQTEDVTDQVRMADERSALQEQVIAAQQATLRELGTPIVPISDGVVAMPLIGAIDSARAQQVIETLLEGVTTSHASIAILDITGVQVVDTQVANTLLRAAQAVRLLGTQVVLTGIRPEVAQTLVGLGLDLSGITTLASLQTGISYALRKAAM